MQHNKFIFHGRDLLNEGTRYIKDFLRRQKALSDKPVAEALCSYIADTGLDCLDYPPSMFMATALRESNLSVVSSKVSTAYGYYQMLKGTYEYAIKELVKDVKRGHSDDEPFVSSLQNILDNHSIPRYGNVTPWLLLDESRQSILNDFATSTKLVDKLWGYYIRDLLSLIDRYRPVYRDEFFSILTDDAMSTLALLCHHVGSFGVYNIIKRIPLEAIAPYRDGKLDAPDVTLIVSKVDLNDAMMEAYKGKVTKWNNAEAIMSSLTAAQVFHAALLIDIAPDLNLTYFSKKGNADE